MNKTYKYLFVAFATMGLLFSCKDLEVPNENTPDFTQVLATPEDVEVVAAGLYNTIFQAENRSGGVNAMLTVAADHVTCSYGNFGMRFMSNEPRNLDWDNSPTYANANQTKFSYDRWYSSIGSASDVLTAIDIQGMEIVVEGVDQTIRSKAFAKFALGLAYGNLALVFDRAHVVDESITVESTLETALPYQQVADAAIAYLEEALALSEASFTIPASWLGGGAAISSADFRKIINTSAARILSYVPRNKADLANVDWARVRTYADNGITADWNVVMDGTSTATSWYFEAADYLTYPGWGKTDMYVVNLMDPSQPQHWGDVNRPHIPASTPNPGVVDNRLFSDFAFTPGNDFPSERGFYHFTNYRFSRYDDLYITITGPKPTVAVVENEMLKAEARAYTGDLAGAAAIINAGTRVTRGHLAPVAADLNAIIDAIHHERHVELYTVGALVPFYEMRKLDLLQTGTPLHLPIPGATLQLFGLTEYYTFGGIVSPNGDGIGTSNGGWR